MATLIKMMGAPEIDRQALTDKLTSDDADLRREGVLSLGEEPFASLETTPDLLAGMALEDENALIRLTAVKILRHFPNYAGLFDVYTRTSRDTDPLVRETTVQVLKHFRNSKESVSILLERLAQDDNVAVRGQASLELGNYRDKRAIPALIEVLDDPDFQVCYYALRSLQRLTGRDFAYDSAQWRQWLETSDQWFAPMAGDY